MISVLLALFTTSATLQGQVRIKKDDADKADRSHVVVYLEGAPRAPAWTGTAPTITQRDLTFVPDINVVTVGTRIEFPNEDKVFHNVFSVSEAAKFDLGLYKSGERKSVTFHKPGVVDIYCNIHPDMVAKVKVLDTKHYAVTGKDGAYRLSGVPAGKFVLVAWQAWGEETRVPVEVAEGATLTTDLQLIEGPKAKRHMRKDGTPYGRYK